MKITFYFVLFSSLLFTLHLCAEDQTEGETLSKGLSKGWQITIISISTGLMVFAFVLGCSYCDDNSRKSPPPQRG